MKILRRYDKAGQFKGYSIDMELDEARRVRQALIDLDVVRLGNYGGILEALRNVIPQQHEDE